MFVSSANSFAQAVVRQFNRSLMYIGKSRGPIMLPCGTPQLISLAFDKVPLTLQFLGLLLKYKANHRKEF